MGMVSGSQRPSRPSATKQRSGFSPIRNGRPRNCCAPRGGVASSPSSARPALWNSDSWTGTYSDIALLLLAQQTPTVSWYQEGPREEGCLESVFLALHRLDNPRLCVRHDQTLH